jgi:hypothetical protein
MDQVWPWLTLAGLGAFHGLNPAMGWLFAVALGMHRGSGKVVAASLVPIALGHAGAVALTAAVLASAGLLVAPEILRPVCGAALLLWALWHWRYGHRHRVRFGMTAGMAGLAVWSFLMAGAHGAGLMLLPALLPICFSGEVVPSNLAGPLQTAMLGVSVHTAAMLLVTGAVAGIVYGWSGLGFLRAAWFNVDLVWVAALALTGAFLLLA